MKIFNPIVDVEGCEIILDEGAWPNFHDAEVHNLNIWRGDVRPDKNVWVGPVIEVSFELCALKNPYIVVLKFHDCESIKLEEFNHQNALFDLEFRFEERGILANGEPLTPYVLVSFQNAFGVELSFKCFRVQAIERKITNET